MLLLNSGLKLICRHTQCESMTAHYEVCILLIEFEEESFGFRVSFYFPRPRWVAIAMKASQTAVTDDPAERRQQPQQGRRATQARRLVVRLLPPVQARPARPPFPQATHHLVLVAA